LKIGSIFHLFNKAGYGLYPRLQDLINDKKLVPIACAVFQVLSPGNADIGLERIFVSEKIPPLFKSRCVGYPFLQPFR